MTGGKKSPADARSDFGAILRKLYRNRFSNSDLEKMQAVWKVLVRDFFQKRVGIDATVLDIGAGPCLFINAIQASRRIALDANPDVRVHAAPGVETLVTEDLSLDELGGESVDCVFLSNVLEHMPDYTSVLGLLARIFEKLRPGGSLLILQPNYRLAGSRYFDFIDHSMILTDSSLLEAVTAVGFEVAELKVRFLPYTSKSRLPSRPWLVALYLRFSPAQWLFGKQSFVLAVKPVQNR